MTIPQDTPRYNGPSTYKGRSPKFISEDIQLVHRLTLKKHHVETTEDTDQCSIQPGNGFNRTGQNKTLQVPTSPIRRRSSFQGHAFPAQCASPESPEGGIALHITSRTPLRMRSFSIDVFKTSTSLPRTHGARRPQYATTLLGSPARRGHRSRMKQIFEDSRQENWHALLPKQEPSTGLRAGSSNRIVPSSADSGYRYIHPLSQTLRTCSIEPRSRMTNPSHQKVQAHISTVPEVSTQLSQGRGLPALDSGSWSGDSDYLTVEPPPSQPHSSKIVAPKPRIDDWLAAVPSNPSSCKRNSAFSVRGTGNSSRYSGRHRSNSDRTFAHPSIRGGKLSRTPSASSTSSESSLNSGVCIKGGVQLPDSGSDVDMSEGGIALTSPLTPAAMTGKPDSDRPQASSICGSADEGGVPLSPNVCIERGHRRHNKRDGGVLIAPGRSAKFTRFGGPSARPRSHTSPSIGHLPVMASGGVRSECKVKW